MPQELLEYLGEESNTALAENGCCDVCSSDLELIDNQKEVSAAIQAVQEIPDYGERKVRLYQGRVVTVHQGCVTIVMPPYTSQNSNATILLIQLSKWIRGPRSEHVRKILQTVPTSSTYGIGAPFNMSLEGW